MSFITRQRRFGAGILVAGSVMVGVAAPAYAGSWSTSFSNKGNGWESASWTDHDSDDLTKVTFGSCTRDFDARIRRNLPLFDSTWGAERINCTSYTDAVVTDSKPVLDDYHFDIGGMGQAYCAFGTCPSNLTSASGVTVVW